MLRALSQSVPPDARNGLAQQRLATVGSTVDDLFNAVTIVNPGGSYTLATERSPLPLALRNDLPVPIRVRLQRRRAAGHDGDRHGRDRTATRLPAAAGADRGALHPARRRRRGAAHRGRAAARRAGAAVGALQRVRQGAVLHHAVGGRGAGRARRSPVVAPVPRPARSRRPRSPGSTRGRAGPHRRRPGTAHARSKTRPAHARSNDQDPPRREEQDQTRFTRAKSGGNEFRRPAGRAGAATVQPWRWPVRSPTAPRPPGAAAARDTRLSAATTPSEDAAAPAAAAHPAGTGTAAARRSA